MIKKFSLNMFIQYFQIKPSFKLVTKMRPVFGLFVFVEDSYIYPMKIVGQIALNKH